MSTVGIFVDRQTLSYASKLNMLMRVREAIEALGHRSYFMFPTEIKKVARIDALFIRARTDPLLVSYVAAKMAALHGIPVVDDPVSIQICCDKVNMYLHLIRSGVPVPRTVLLSRDEISESRIREVFEALGSPLILKEPSTSYSQRVRKFAQVGDAVRMAHAWAKLSDRLVAQEYVESTEDWRIGMLGGKFLFASRYALPKEGERADDYGSDEVPDYSIECVPRGRVPETIIELAARAASAIGNGLYSVDIKEGQGGPRVIEVNDNPSLESGEEELYPDVYGRIISYLLEEGQGGCRAD